MDRSWLAATNALVVVAWGHGGRQGQTPVLHVRGPRITAADFKGLASQAGARESRWVLMFRGSGAFASELAGEGRQIISSEGETMFSDDPVGMPLLLKLAKEKPELRFAELAEELGRATEAWYADRHLARTEEPTLWAGPDKPRQLAAPAAEDNALASVKPAESGESATNASGAGLPVNVAVSGDLSAAWKEIKRVEAREYPEADAVILRRRLSYTLGSNPAIATEQEEFIQVLTAEGKHYGDFDISYSPPYEDITFLDCEVLRPDGKLAAAGPGRDSRHARAVSGRLPMGAAEVLLLAGGEPRRRAACALPDDVEDVSAAAGLAGDSDWSGPGGSSKRTVQVSVAKETPFHFALEQVAAADPVIKQTTYGTTYSWRFENLPAQEHEILVSPGLAVAAADFHLPRLGGVCGVVWTDQQADG